MAIRFFPGKRQSRRPERSVSAGFGLWVFVAVAIGLAIFADFDATSPREASSTFPAELSGIATVIDGDTLEIASRRIRLGGIDAPEHGQLCRDFNGRSYDCGAEATQALRGFIADTGEVRCAISERDHYDRMIGDCRRGDGQSIAAWLVEQGHALDWPRYSGGAYAGQQRIAEAEHRGLWAGSFERPWDWRAEQRLQTAAPRDPMAGLVSAAIDPTGDCRIKGNINADGERIYHMPGQEFYELTRITPETGERWFCTQAEAREAGWRPARR